MPTSRPMGEDGAMGLLDTYSPDPDRYDGRMPQRRCGLSGLTLPVVVRLQGTNVEAGREMLAKSGMNIQAADDLTTAAKLAVAAAAK